MAQSESPLSRPIGIGGAIRWFIALATVVAIGAAFAAGKVALGVVGFAVLLGELVLDYFSRRAGKK